MIYPSIDKILNIVESKYQLVHIVAKRSKQMIVDKHYQMKQTEYHSKKEIGKALEEVERGLVNVSVN